MTVHGVNVRRADFEQALGQEPGLSGGRCRGSGTAQTLQPGLGGARRQRRESCIFQSFCTGAGGYSSQGCGHRCACHVAKRPRGSDTQLAFQQCRARFHLRRSSVVVARRGEGLDEHDVRALVQRLAAHHDASEGDSGLRVITRQRPPSRFANSGQHLGIHSQPLHQ